MALPFKMAQRIARVPKTSVWSEFTPLATECKAINLGQGFPTFPLEDFVKQEAASVFLGSDPLQHQYCRSLGHPELVQVLRKRYSALLGREIGMNEIEVTNGTTQALNLAFQATIEAGDEVIVIEPFFDLYTTDVEMAGGIPVFLSLKPNGRTGNDWVLDWAELEAKITNRTKAILVNTPQNVPGKVWSREELLRLAEVAQRRNLFVFADEVYDRLTYDGMDHVSIASLPGMWDRTITMCSSGKTLCSTGWKIGWTIANPEISQAIHNAQNNQSFSVCTPLQIAVARALTLAESNDYFNKLPQSYTERRSQLVEALESAGLPCIVPQGSFFVLADISGFDESLYVDANSTEDIGKDWHFCRWLTKNIGVSAIPVTAFCRPESRPLYEKYARFAFCKTEEMIAEAAIRLQKLKDLARK